MPVEHKKEEDSGTVAFGELDGEGMLHQQIYRLLRTQIGRLRFMPNQLLSETDVAGALGVSRTPVREAFIRLAEEGVVRIVPKSGTYVAPVDVNRAREGFFIWRGLESSCASLVAERCAIATIGALRTLVSTQKNCADAGDRDGFYAANDEFHRRLFELAGFPGARDMMADARFEIDRLFGLLGMAPFAMSDEVIDELRDIVNAIADGGPEEARRCAGRHLERVGNAIEAAGEDEALLRGLNERKPARRKTTGR